MGISVLFVEDEVNARQNIGKFLQDKGYEFLEAGTLAEARIFLQKGTGDVILLDVELPDGYGPTLLYEIGAMQVRPPVIVVTAYKDIETAVDVMKNGASDFLNNQLTLPNWRNRCKKRVNWFKCGGNWRITGNSRFKKVILL